MRARMFLAGFLAILIGLPAPVAAQQQPPPAQPAPAAQPVPEGQPPAAAQAPPAAPAATIETLKVLVLQGQNAVNSIKEGMVTMPVVEVHDENDLPLEGADVLFELPATGPGGTFPGNQFTKTVKSNLQGQAGALFMLNSETGKYTIKVTASLRNRTGHATITQSNVLEAALAETGKRKIKWWKVAIAVGAAGLVVGIVLAVRGGGGSPSNTVTLTPGTPTFGTP